METVFNLTKYAANEPTKEMKDWFFSRTKKHIELVAKYCNILADEYKEFSALKARAKVHDQSKYEEEEYEPYLWISWKYKCKDDGKDFKVPEDIEKKMHKATLHHVTTNSHHPEYHSPTKDNLINTKNRDKAPKEIIDATTMPELDIAEMIADFAAMSEEKNTDIIDWINKNINKRWKFTKDQVNLIYKLADFLKDNFLQNDIK